MEPLKFVVGVGTVVNSQIDEQRLKKVLGVIADAAERNRTYNFKASVRARNIHIEKEDDGDGGYRFRYSVNIIITKENYRSAGVVREQFDNVLRQMESACRRVKWDFLGETVMPAPGEAPVAATPKPEKAPKVIRSRTSLELPPLTPEVYEKYFGRLFNREPQVRIIYDAIKQAVQTGFRERNHILLRGLAGCGKTEVLGGKNVSGGFYEWLGEEAVWEVDSTTLTKAGLERELLSRSKDGTLPPIIKLEEVEKVTEPRTVNCLLQVMDVRGRIQRTNARDGDEFADCKVLVLGTCNDSKLLRTFADGAVWSRFALRPICKRPDRATMTKILLRTCKEVIQEGGWCGDERHVEKVVSFMWDTLKEMREYRQDYNDPRLGRALLSGGDRILDEGPEGFLADFSKVCDGDEVGEVEDER